MKSKKPKYTKLTKPQIKRGIFVNAIQRVQEIPYRKLDIDDFKEVRFARKALIVTENGKPLAIILPLAKR